MVGMYDVMQVCLNGHRINSEARRQPQFNKSFCPQCGGRTITDCADCHAPIQGAYIAEPVLVVPYSPPVPNYCHSCGALYPWRQAQIAAAIEALEINLQGPDAAEAAELLRASAVETPRTEVAARKLKLLLSKLGKPVYDVTVEVISTVLAETARKIFFPLP